VSAISPRSATRLLAMLYLAGCALGLASMLLPQPPDQNDAEIYAVLAASFVIGTGLLVAGPRRPQPLLFVALAGTSLLITAGIYATTRPASVYALFYVGMALVAFLLLGSRAALAQVGVVAVAYGALMLHEQPPGAAEQWFITVGTVLAVGLMVGAMRRQVEALVTELSTSVDRLAEAATTDALTGLANRRGFDEASERELARMGRGEPPFALVLCDLDHFKKVNDSLGHPAGDLVLKRVADAFRATVRDVDTVARVGGEEFGMLLPGTDEAEAIAVADRLRDAVERAFASDRFALTASCGVATAVEHPAADALMRAADTALYAAKKLGRNRSVAHGPHLPAILRFELEGALHETPSESHTVGHHAEMIAQALELPPADTPLEARILAVAAVYVAMTSDRPSRAAKGHEAAARELRACAGTHLDPHVVETFLSAIGEERAPALHFPPMAPVR
jgi:diguanylate cyclase (GGDEF)-like protein